MQDPGLGRSWTKKIIITKDIMGQLANFECGLQIRQWYCIHLSFLISMVVFGYVNEGSCSQEIHADTQKEQDVCVLFTLKWFRKNTNVYLEK